MGHSGVIQGSFRGGRAPVLQARAVPASVQPKTPPVSSGPRVIAPPPIRFPNQKPAPAQAKPVAKSGRLPPPPLPKPALQAKPAPTATPRVLQLKGGGEAFAVPSALNLSTSGGQPLPGAVREKMESFFRTSFSDVRVHVGNQAPSIGALAFTHGSNLYFAPGQYNPNTAHGQQLLGHELTHVMQQRAGRVKNPFGTGVAVVQDHSLEAEADRMGMRAAAGYLQAALPRTSHGPNATIPGSATADRIGKLVIQRLTLLSYNPVHNRPGTDQIVAPQHARIAHTATETTNAAWKSGYNVGATPGGGCKHYVAYDMVKTAVFNRLIGMASLRHAVVWLNGRNMLGAGHYQCPIDGLWYPLGAQPAPNIPNVGTALAPQYQEAVLNTQVDDFIKNLANDPRNLYYRATSTGDNGGTQLDVPTGGGQRTINAEVNGYVGEGGGLAGYRNYLLNTIGLVGV